MMAWRDHLSNRARYVGAVVLEQERFGTRFSADTTLRWNWIVNEEEWLMRRDRFDRLKFKLRFLVSCAFVARFSRVPVAVFTAMLVGAGTARAQYTLTTLVTFGDTNGAHPYCDLLADGNRNLYGTTLLGNVFSVAAGTHTLTNL